MARLCSLILAIGFAMAVPALANEPVPVPSADGSAFEIDRVFGRPGERLCRSVALAAPDTLPVSHADCGMGRHCPDDTRCCMTSADFWCCPSDSKCDYEQPGNCRSK